MKVSVDISPEHKEPFAVIHTDRMTEEIMRLTELIGYGSPVPITATAEETTVILRPRDIYMVRIEDKQTVIFGREARYRSDKRLYELKTQLGSGFLQISKSTLVNLSYLQSVKTGFGGSMLLTLKNGNSDYVSRKYLPDLKRYLGL